ncbi:hypothetical protein C3495_12920 [Clostridiaceae bacterium 14S0207]|nr:hypothetical protein C3495_12920 [Clostridiaceae bacterium 14S0207]
MLDIPKKKYTAIEILKFLIPSLIGVLFFMIPMKLGGKLTIPVAFLSNYLLNLISTYLPLIMTIIICISLIGSVISKLFKPNFIVNNSFLNKLLNVTPVWFTMRILGSAFAVCTFFKVGPQWISSNDTGGLLLFDLLPILFCVFLFAGMFLPLLLNFGLLEFFGALLTKVMRPIFTLPGRSSVDCIASWLGDGTIGVLLTSKQYEDGYYSKREAAVIGTTFSFVSITFSLVVLSQVKLAHMFVPFYLTILFAGIFAAIIMPRIPPLSKKADTFHLNKTQQVKEAIPEGHTAFSWGVDQAIERASKNTSLIKILQEGIENVLDMWIGVAPVVMTIGSIALILAQYTPIFRWLGIPFIPLLKLLQIPEAAHASQTLVVGFADMFLPTVIGSTINSELTRFVIACVSVTQLIYMSEVGGLLIGSEIPVSMKDLIIIFLERTLITLPIISLIAHFLF